jgi:C_GCAxxG_C_C family probable redox protein
MSIMSEKTRHATERFRSGFNCSQSVLSAFAEDFGLSKDSCLRLASPFGSGIARMQETCGAITGALMAIGLKYGKGENGTEDDKTIAYRQSQQLINEFKERNTTICCRQLLDGHDINSPEGMAKIMELDLYHNYCLKYIQDAVEITETILSEKDKH